MLRRYQDPAELMNGETGPVPDLVSPQGAPKAGDGIGYPIEVREGRAIERRPAGLGVGSARGDALQGIAGARTPSHFVISAAGAVIERAA